MIKIEMHFPDFAAAAAALTRMAGTATGGVAQSEAFAQMTPVGVAPDPAAAETPALPETLASPNFRLIGSAGDGRTRRTKVEMAEDDELLALGGGFGLDQAALNASILNQGRAVVQHDLAESGKALPSANISTAPEDRQDPENPEPADEPADEPEADAADVVTAHTVDDVRAAIRAAMIRLGSARTAQIMQDVGKEMSATKIKPANYAALIEALATAKKDGE